MSSTAVNLSHLSNALLVWRLSFTQAVMRLAIWLARKPVPGRCCTPATPQYVWMQQHYPSLHYARSPSIRRHAQHGHNHKSVSRSLGNIMIGLWFWHIVASLSYSTPLVTDWKFRLATSAIQLLLPRDGLHLGPSLPDQFFPAHSILHHSYHLAFCSPLPYLQYQF